MARPGRGEEAEDQQEEEQRMRRQKERHDVVPADEPGVNDRGQDEAVCKLDKPKCGEDVSTSRRARLIAS
jgi:hypothetical protein